jgi:hypothetical protein
MTISQPTPASDNDLAIVYLARFAEGPRPVEAFIASCRQYEAGIAHDRVVIRKGFPDKDTAQDKALTPFFATSISVPDDGYDITAYAEAARQLPHRHLVFLNTFSEIRSDNWLLKLRSAFDDPSVGIAGASGSYESLHSSMKRLRKGMFLSQHTLVPAQAGLRRAFHFVRRLLPKEIAKRLVAKLISYFAVRAARPQRGPSRDGEFEAYWAAETSAGGMYDYLSTIPPFPNPHIRTNAFLIERQTFLDTLPPSVTTKQDSYLFESGPDGLTQQVLRRGKSVVIVGRNGQIYGVDRWAESGTFRLGSQSNLLVHDNQTRAFDDLNSEEKRAFAEMTWGEAERAGPG